MSRNTQYYSQKNHSVILTPANGGSIVLSDFSADAPIAWGYVSNEKITVTEGFDAARISVASTKAGKITIKLKPTSPQVGYLIRKCNEYKRGILTLFDVSIRTGVNEEHRLHNAAVQHEDSDTGGTTMSDRTFVFIGEELIEDPA